MMTQDENERLTRAKKVINSRIGPHRRKWLTAEVKSYNGDMYITRMHVLQGTPPQGYVLENEQFGVCVIISSNGEYLGRVKGGDSGLDPTRFYPSRRK